MRNEILQLLDAKDRQGASPKWIAAALELLLRIELAKLAAVERDRKATAA